MRRLVSALAPRVLALEAMFGLGLATVGVALVAGRGWACIVAGAVIFTFAVWGRRIT